MTMIPHHKRPHARRAYLPPHMGVSTWALLAVTLIALLIGILVCRCG